jgi:putative polymerase
MRSVSANTATALSHAGGRLVLVGLTFNMMLCFISTNANIHMSSAVVAVIELIILSFGVYFMRSRISDQAVRIIGVVAVALIGLKFVNAKLDLKILHDIGIMYIFYELGMLSTLREANRLVWICMAIVLGVSVFEVALPVQFGTVFNVWSYYVDKGGIAAGTINYSNTTGFLSGARGGSEARTYLPGLLGPTRFSSVFLEPVSMGNFAVIAFAWCLSTHVGGTKGRLALVFCAAITFVLCDSRFASACWVLMFLLRITPLHRSRFVIFCLPLMVMLGLLINGSIHEMPGVLPSILSDNFPGRLLFSGRLLDYWGGPQWLGLQASQVYTSDTGYAYVINNLSLPLALFLLGVFAFHKPQTAEAYAMKAMITVYMATSLCIGANMFTIKTAGLCWFLYGASNTIPALRRKVAAPARPGPQFGTASLGGAE